MHYLVFCCTCWRQWFGKWGIYQVYFTHLETYRRLTYLFVNRVFHMSYSGRHWNVSTVLVINLSGYKLLDRIITWLVLNLKLIIHYQYYLFAWKGYATITNRIIISKDTYHLMPFSFTKALCCFSINIFFKKR